MFHHVAHAIHDRPLFTDWEGAAALWQDLERELTGVEAAVLMPDHLHVVARSEQWWPVVQVVAAYSRWCCWERGERGRLWEPVPRPEAFSGVAHRRRGVRYVHLNPCRAELVSCPSGWPFSTYRGRLGLAARPLVAPAGAPEALHQRTSADQSTRSDGTPFPGGRLPHDRPELMALAGAVSEWRRVPLSQLLTHRRERVWLLGAAKTLTGWSGADIARAYDVSPSAVSRAERLGPADARAVERLLVDERTPGLLARDPRLLRWRPRPWPRRGSR